MALREALKKTGRNVNTLNEILFNKGTRSTISGSGSGSGKIPYLFATSDYIADTSVPEANYRIDVNHTLQTQIYSWHIFKTEDGRAIVPVDWSQGDNILSLWFVGNTKTIRVIIDP